MEGDSVTLHSGRVEYDDWIQWWFMNKNIAEINVPQGRFTVYDDVLDGRFRDKLKLDHQTGSLTITNITTQHAGVYELEFNTMSRPSFYLTVYGELNIIFTCFIYYCFKDDINILYRCCFILLSLFFLHL